MNKKGKIWLAFLIIPFVIGVLVLIYVPLHMILSSNPKLEQNFNGYKIQMELNTVRAISVFNSKILKSRLQMPLNIMSTIISLFNLSDPIKVMNFTNLQLNSAYLLANQMNSSDFIPSRSMWYSNKATEKQNFDTIQTNIYNSFLQVQPLIMSTFGSGYDIYSTITKLQLIIDYENHQLCFSYPSEIKPELGVGNATVLNNYYFNTIKNQKQQLFYTTLFDLGKQIRACTAFSYANSSDLNAVACVDLSIQIFVNDTRSVTNISTIQLSTYDYYFVRPLYKFEGLINPQIISNFSTSDLTILDKPINKYFELDKNNLSRDLFEGNRNYTTKIKRVERTKTYFIFPISAYDYGLNQNISFYMILLNNFARAELLKQSRNERISVLMVVPSAVLLVLSIIISLCVLKVIIKKLGKALNLIEQYCSLIKRNDLELQILDNNEADDMQELFDKMRMLNQMSKYSNYEYFNVPKPERVIKLLKCSKIFDELGYGKSNLYQNLSECYVSIGDYENAIKYLRISIDMAIKQIYGELPQIDIIYQAKVNDRFKPGREFRRKQHIVIRKILRFCQILYISGEIQKKKEVELQITNRAELLRKIIYPEILNYEYIGCIMFIISYKIKNKEFVDIDSKMEILNELIQGYQEVNESQQNCKVDPQILMAYWHSMMANMFLMQEKYVPAYQHFIESLKGNRFNPDVQFKVYKQIKRILDMNNVPKKQLSYLKFPEQYLSRGDREYLFLIDISNPNAKINDINIWKKKGRKMTDTIFTNLIHNNDRVSIIQFCLNIKIVCNLVQKANRQKLIKKELLNSFKTREQLVNSQFFPCFSRAVERVRNLKKEKVFLIFLKKGEQINCRLIENEARQLENYKIIIIVEDMEMVEEKSEDIYVILLENVESVNRILQEKVVKYADNIAYIF